jgi:hypothetical protein
MNRGSDAAVTVNGIDAITGDYLLPGLTRHDVAAIARRGADDGPSSQELRARHRRATERRFAPRHGIDAADLAQAGWGAVFAADADPAVRAALSPLLEYRQRQAGARAEHRYREFAGPDGVRRGESKQSFKRRHGSGPGPVDPDIMPYYLLLVGNPEELPFTVHAQLSVQHAVGRLSFDEISDYRRYAESVVAAETALPSRPPNLSIFAPHHEGDRATALSAEHLATPLAAQLENDLDSQHVCSAIGPTASRQHLVEQLIGPTRPDVLLAVSHGIGLPCGHPRQRRTQGALLCQDWPGLGHGPVQPAQCFGADDVAQLGAADLGGMIPLLLACFGAGTPRHDSYQREGANRTVIAPDSFVAALPQALLGREGGASAVVGQVDRAWSYSFLWPGAGRQTEAYRGALARLCAGHTVGFALEYVGDRHAELASDLGAVLEEIHLGKRVDDDTLAELWTACVDARSLIVLGDPAVRARSTGRPAALHRLRDTVHTLDVATRKEPRPVGRPVEVATYVADDPAAVGFDMGTGRITGARLHVLSRMELDGNATHVVGPDHLAMPDARQRDAVVDLHARLIAASVAARTASQGSGGEEGAE